MTKAENLLRELVALPSVNPAFLPPGHPRAGEQRVAEFLAAAARQAGLEIEFQEAAPGRPNLLVRLPAAGPARSRVMLAPHLDTVNGTDEQFSPVVRNGRLYGRGACDTKGSVAAMFTTLCDLAQNGVRPRQTEILFAGLIDEENAQLGSRALAAGGLRADLAIVGEPTRAKVVTSHKGNLWVEISVSGKSAHGAEPQKGINAIHLMSRAVDALEDEYAVRLRKTRHPVLGFGTVSVGTIEGGAQPNIVPDRCVITIDRRTLPGETEEQVINDLGTFLRKKHIKAEVNSLKTGACPPLETQSDLPQVQSLLRAAGQRRPLGANYFCDAAILAGSGIPSVVFGPGDISQAHTADEWISLESLDDATAILKQYLTQLP